jgi:uncharacterized protein YjdB
MRNTGTALAAVVVLSAPLGFGCSPTPVTIEVSPPDVTITDKSESPTFTTRVLDREDKPIEGSVIAWSSGDETVAKIDPATGKLQVVASGRVEIKAETGHTYGIAMVTVQLYDKISTDTKSLVLRIGEVRKVEATILDEQGEPISGEIVWESADPKIASIVGSRGEIRAVASGTTTVTAKAKELEADVKVEVMQSGPYELGVSKAIVNVKPGKTVKVEGLPLDENNQPAAGYTVAYATEDSDVATVAADGTVTGVAEGETQIEVSAGDKLVYIKVRVKP